MKVTVGLGYTKNMGNYESLRFDFGVEADANEGESFKDAAVRLRAEVEEVLLDAIKEVNDDLEEVNG